MGLTERKKRILRAIIDSYDYVLSLDLLKEEVQEDSGVDAEFEAYVLVKIEERKAAKKEESGADGDAEVAKGDDAESNDPAESNEPSESNEPAAEPHYTITER